MGDPGGPGEDHVKNHEEQKKLLRDVSTRAHLGVSWTQGGGWETGNRTSKKKTEERGVMIWRAHPKGGEVVKGRKGPARGGKNGGGPWLRGSVPHGK